MEVILLWWWCFVVDSKFFIVLCRPVIAFLVNPLEAIVGL